MQRQLEKIPGVDHAAVDWKAKQAEVFATPEGFDPAAVLPVIQETGFVAPGAELGFEVTAVGTLSLEGDELFLVLPEARWQLEGQSGAQLSEAPLPERVRLRGTLTSPEDAMPVLKGASRE